MSNNSVHDVFLDTGYRLVTGDRLVTGEFDG